MIYIGIDIAKHLHFASAVNSDGEVLIKPFGFSNSQDGFDMLLQQIINFDKNNCIIGLEATGHYGNNLVNFLTQFNYKIGIINPIQTNSLRNSNIRKTKTDKIDTFLISKCLLMGNYTIYQPKLSTITKLQTICRFRFDVLESQTKLKTQLVGCLDLIFPELANFFKGNLHINVSYALLLKYPSPTLISKVRIDTLSNFLKNNSRGRYSTQKAIQLKEIAKNSIGIDNSAISFQIQYIIQQLSLIKSQISSIDANIKETMINLNTYITTIPGIGYVLGAIIISEIGDISRFSSPSKLQAFAGLDPSTRQSGNFNATTTRISKRGSKYLRYAIHMAASISIWINDELHLYYTTKRSQGKAYRNAIGHVSGKLIRIIYKILYDNVPFKLS